MTVFVELDGNVVATVSRPPVEGWAEAPDDTLPGDELQEDGSFYRPAPPEPSGSNPDDPLTRVQFEAMLAITGLEDVWSAVEAWAKLNNLPLYARLRGQRVNQTFRLEVTLDFVAEIRSLAAFLGIETDLSDEAIRTAWALAHTL